MRTRLVAAVLAAGIASAATAQETTADLREALGLLPEIVITQPEVELAYFVGMAAFGEISGGLDDRQALYRLSAAGYSRPFNALIAGGAESWSANAGIDISEVRYFSGFGQPPNALAVWGLDSAERADALLVDLAASGFEPANEEGLPGGLANGVPGSINPEARDPANPWTGPIGQTSFVAAHGNMILQSSRPEAITFVRDDVEGRSLADNPVVATALAGLDERGDRIVQALVVSPALGVLADPLATIVPRRDIEEIRRELEEAMAALGEGIPPFFGGIIADIQQGDRPGVAFSLTYPDCETAGIAAGRIVERWATSYGEELTAEVETAEIPGVEGTCAAVTTILGEAGDDAANMVFARVHGDIARRQFTVLQIGETQ